MSPEHPATPDAGPDPMPGTVVRTGAGTFRGTNARGASVEIGDGEGRFRPGELLKIALAGCAAMSTEFTLTRRLGEDYDAEFVVAGPKDAAENRYDRFVETMRVDLADLDEAGRARVEHLVERAIAQACTVERSISAGVAVEHHLVDTGRLDVGQTPAAPSSEEQPS